MLCPFCQFEAEDFEEEYITPPDFVLGECYIIYWCPRCDNAHRDPVGGQCWRTKGIGGKAE
jgi:hypothetical protein